MELLNDLTKITDSFWGFVTVIWLWFGVIWEHWISKILYVGGTFALIFSLGILAIRIVVALIKDMIADIRKEKLRLREEFRIKFPRVALHPWKDRLALLLTAIVCFLIMMTVIFLLARIPRLYWG